MPSLRTLFVPVTKLSSPPARIPFGSCTKRGISYHSHGRAIDREDLTKYDGGRFLHREQLQLHNRRMNLNVDELCTLLSSLGATKSAIKSIDKHDGIDSRLLFVNKEDSTDLVVKLPFRCNGPSGYATASEVGTMKYLAQNTTFPVPKVLAWNSDLTNDIGTEYIVMQKATGVALSTLWEDMSLRTQKELATNLVKLQSQLSAIKFPCFGNLYLRESLQDKDPQTRLGHSIDPTQSFCIGPATHTDMLHESEDGLYHDVFDRGPLPYMSSFGIAYAQREIARTARLPDDDETVLGCTKREQMDILHKAIAVMKALDHLDILGYSAFPALWRQNIDLKSVFVSTDDPTTITSILDWRSVDISPLYLRCGIPLMLRPTGHYQSGLEESAQPRLPEDFNSLPASEQDELRHVLKRSLATKHYERMSSIFNPIAFKAIQVPSVLDIYDLVSRVSDTHSDSDLHNLERCLIYLSQTWADLEIPTWPEPPITFTQDQIDQHEERNEAHNIRQNLLSQVCTQLDTRLDGFIKPDRDFDEVKKMNRDMFEELLRHIGNREGTLVIWPFHEGLEDTNTNTNTGHGPGQTP